jgi:hypothetical protein
VPVSVVAASQGKSITVVYAVVRNGQPGKLSLPLVLTVGELATGELEAPTVPEATGSMLDLRTFEGNATVVVAAWPLIAEGQRYWIKITGTLENGSPYTFYAARNQAVTAAEVGSGLSKAVTRAELEKLKPNTALNIEVRVAFDQGSNESAARKFPSIELVVIGRYSEGEEDWSTVPVQSFHIGQPVTFLSGITAELIQNRPWGYYNGIHSTPPIHSLLISGLSTVKITFPGIIRNFSAEELANEAQVNSIQYFNNRQLLYTQTSPPAYNTPPVPFSYSAPEGTHITHLLLIGEHPTQAGYFINNLKWS